MKFLAYLLGSLIFAAGIFLCLCGDWKWAIYEAIGFGIILIGDERH